MNKKGFTLVEIVAVVALIAVISAAAILAVTSIINRQRIKTATLSEKNIGETALSIQSEKHDLYLPACVDKTSGSYVNITELIVKKINDDLRAQMEHDGKTTREQKETFVKNYIKTINTNEGYKNNFANDYLNVKDASCFQVTSVADMIKDGYLKDLDNGCDTASLIVVYNKGDSSNKAGNLKSVQENGICKGSESEEKGPLITVSPEKDLRSTAKKTVKITATANESNLESNLVLKYGWSKSLRKKPSEWETVDLVGDHTKVSAEVSKTGADEEFYLWIAAGSVKDNKGYSNTTFATGPYSFLPTPTIKYLSLNEDPTFPLRGGKRCDAETTCNDKTKVVVYSKPYGKDVDGYEALLCKPNCKGYTFNTWKYTDLNINDTSIVGERNNHNLTAIYTANEYKVTYDVNGGGGCDPNWKKVTFDNKYGELCSTHSRTGYTPRGWWTDANAGSEITSETYVSTDSDHTIHAHWEANPFYVAYNGNGATSGSVANHQCIYDQPCTLKANGFNKTSYTFNGWKKDNTGTALKAGASIKNATAIRDQIVTYYAQWCNNCVTPAHGTCTLDANSTPGTCKYTTSCSAGYSITNNGKYNPACNLITYNISYNLDGGTVSGNPTTYTVETNSFTLKNPTRAGYTFEGWSGTGISGKSSTVTVAKGSTGNRSYKANWKVITYSIRYTLNSGTVSGNPTTYTVETPTITLKNPTRTGYTFVGWSGTGLSGTGNKTVKINKGSTGNRSYTANWTRITYAISYNLDGGSVSGNPTSYNVDTATFTLKNPTRAGYTFVGWSGTGLSGTGNKTVKVNKGSTGNRSYKANWSVNLLKINATGRTAEQNNHKNSADQFNYPREQLNSDGQNITYNYLGCSGLSNKDIQYIYLRVNNDVPGGFSYVCDVSSNSNGSIKLYRSGRSIAIVSVDSTIKGISYDHLFFGLHNLVAIYNLERLNTSGITDMSWMFACLYNMPNLSLPAAFNTSSVTNMAHMFYKTGRDNPSFMLNLGPSFYTSKVTNMRYMFDENGAHNRNYRFDLGNNFDTSNVTDMQFMFVLNGYRSQAMNTINLGNKFNTSKVTNMRNMFDRMAYEHTGYFEKRFNSLFNTSKVTNMTGMFAGTAHSSRDVHLSLGTNFNTSNVNNMMWMFAGFCFDAHTCDLNLGYKFHMENVRNTTYMFLTSCAHCMNSYLDKGPYFRRPAGVNATGMFDGCGFRECRWN